MGSEFGVEAFFPMDWGYVELFAHAFQADGTPEPEHECYDGGAAHSY